MDNLQKKWDMLLNELAHEVTAVSYHSFFLSLIPKEIDEKANILYIECEKPFIVDIVQKRYIPLLERVAETVLKKHYRVLLEEKETGPVVPQKKDIAAATEKTFKNEYYFNPRYSFENFVVGSNNQYAHAVALAVAETPFKAYNPFFIYSGSGLGKTHLLHAMGHYMLKNHPDLKVLYVSSEMFTEELIRALRDKNRNGSLKEFKEKYRNVDVLLIDDIQFIEGKESTQLEFFHTFNALYDLNKQIIISSDRAPNKLVNLDERLTSRFQWNIIADIQPPDYETRVAILTSKAEIENIEINEDVNAVISLIAEKIKLNIRELEGALNRVIGFSVLFHKPITVPFAREHLKELFSSEDINVSIDTIKRNVCKYFNISIKDIESSKRTRDLTFPRQIAMYLCREMTDYSLPKIGSSFGGRDHTTVLHSYEKISKDIKTQDSLENIIDTIKRNINGS